MEPCATCGAANAPWVRDGVAVCSLPCAPKWPTRGAGRANASTDLLKLARDGSVRVILTSSPSDNMKTILRNTVDELVTSVSSIEPARLTITTTRASPNATTSRVWHAWVFPGGTGASVPFPPELSKYASDDLSLPTNDEGRSEYDLRYLARYDGETGKFSEGTARVAIKLRRRKDAGGDGAMIFGVRSEDGDLAYALDVTAHTPPAEGRRSRQPVAGDSPSTTRAQAAGKRRPVVGARPDDEHEKVKKIFGPAFVRGFGLEEAYRALSFRQTARKEERGIVDSLTAQLFAARENENALREAVKTATAKLRRASELTAQLEEALAHSERRLGTIDDLVGAAQRMVEAAEASQRLRARDQSAWLGGRPDAARGALGTVDEPMAAVEDDRSLVEALQRRPEGGAATAHSPGEREGVPFPWLGRWTGDDVWAQTPPAEGLSGGGDVLGDPDAAWPWSAEGLSGGDVLGDPDAARPWSAEDVLSWSPHETNRFDPL